MTVVRIIVIVIFRETSSPRTCGFIYNTRVYCHVYHMPIHYLGYSLETSSGLTSLWLSYNITHSKTRLSEPHLTVSKRQRRKKRALQPYICPSLCASPNNFPFQTRA